MTKNDTIVKTEILDEKSEKIKKAKQLYFILNELTFGKSKTNKAIGLN